ncbi:TetR/AcrR family transcriptional regulator [soil metagenome]
MPTKRKDAALNSERLILAAREVFARQGLSATLEDIAKHAGVGVGTIYRNFASKQEIVATLYDAAIDSALAEGQGALEIEDPWEAIQTFFEVIAARQAQDRGLHERFLGFGGSGPNEDTAAKLLTALTPLFERASAAGVLRAGISVTDLAPIFAMLNSIYGMSEANPDLWRRYLAVILDGLRATDRPALPVPAMDAAAFTAALTAG